VVESAHETREVARLPVQVANAGKELFRDVTRTSRNVRLVVSVLTAEHLPAVLAPTHLAFLHLFAAPKPPTHPRLLLARPEVDGLLRLGRKPRLELLQPLEDDVAEHLLLEDRECEGSDAGKVETKVLEGLDGQGAVVELGKELGRLPWVCGGD